MRYGTHALQSLLLLTSQLSPAGANTRLPQPSGPARLHHRRGRRSRAFPGPSLSAEATPFPPPTHSRTPLRCSRSSSRHSSSDAHNLDHHDSFFSLLTTAPQVIPQPNTLACGRVCIPTHRSHSLPPACSPLFSYPAFHLLATLLVFVSPRSSSSRRRR